jgi:hypothetical protein
MTRRKIAAFVVSSAAILAAPSLAAQNTGNTSFDECVIECLAAGGGQQGDGRLCRIICAREVEDTKPGGIKGTTPGPPPRAPGGGCPATGTRICPDKV